MGAVMLLRRWVRASVVGGFLLAACGEGSQVPGGPEEPGPTPIPAPVSGVVASAPVARTLLGQAGPGSVAFVAAPVGTVARGRGAVLVNRRTGARVEAVIEEGGFDPVALVADDGDVVEVTLTDSAGQVTTTPLAVKRGTKPRVVRTAPEPRATDVPLNSVIRVVFTTPVRASAAAGAIRLYQGGVEVAGSIQVNGEADVFVDFVPAAPLAANADYELRVDAALTDVLGLSLQAGVVVTFTTGETATAPPLGTPGANEIIFSSFDPSGALGDASGVPSNLFAIRDDGTGLTQLTRSTTLSYDEPSVGRDGRIVFVVRHVDRSELAVREPDGTVHPLLPEAPPEQRWVACPTWSPDASQVAYAAFGDGTGTSLRVVRGDGSGDIVAEIPPHRSCPSWSPDGTQLSYGTASFSMSGGWTTTLTLADASRFPEVSTRDVLTTTPALFGRWSPEGDALVSFVEEGGSIWLERMPLGGGARIRLAGMSVLDCCAITGTSYVPEWSPDGRLILFYTGDSAIQLVDVKAGWLHGSSATLPVAGYSATFVPAGVRFTR